jgi:hypothetical protein
VTAFLGVSVTYLQEYNLSDVGRTTEDHSVRMRAHTLRNGRLTISVQRPLVGVNVKNYLLAFRRTFLLFVLFHSF